MKTHGRAAGGNGPHRALSALGARPFTNDDRRSGMAEQDYEELTLNNLGHGAAGELGDSVPVYG